jgi:hypothetical protein
MKIKTFKHNCILLPEPDVEAGFFTRKKLTFGDQRPLKRTNLSHVYKLYYYWKHIFKNSSSCPQWVSGSKWTFGSSLWHVELASETYMTIGHDCHNSTLQPPYRIDTFFSQSLLLEIFLFLADSETLGSLNFNELKAGSPCFY